jgi:aryl-alcohol dehydrogenase-like predicted oxidoreductase
VFKTGLTDIINENIKTLGVKALDGYMFHNYASLTHNPHLFKEVLRAKKEGIINRVGVSIYTNREIEDIINNYKAVDFVQAPFNLLDNQLKRKRAFEKLKAENIEVHTRSVFLQGLFFSSQKTLNDKICPLEPYLKELENIKKQYSLTTEKLA